MGGRQSKSGGNLLEGSAWLRTVVQHHQKRRQGVSGFDSFIIEPFTEESSIQGLEQFHVSISFRNSKGRPQQVYWVVKVAHHNGNEDILDISDISVNVRALHHEMRVYTELFSELGKFLASKKSLRARFLLNVPDLIFHDKGTRASKVTRCHLVTEDVEETKRCTPLKEQRRQAGLTLGQFKVLLGTLAQFHAVGIAWSQGTRDDSMLDLFPFLARKPTPAEKKARKMHLEMYGRLLEANYKDPNHRKRVLYSELMNKSGDLLDQSLTSEKMCDRFGGLCLGTVMAREVMFQYEQDLSSLFDFCGVGGANNIVLPSSSSDLGEDGNSTEDEVSSPVCAAVTSCHRVHYGNILRELAAFFFTLPESLIRKSYIVFMLQSYCHVLTMTLEMLDVDWQKIFDGMTFHQFVLKFYEHVPSAILQAVCSHMELTDPDELDVYITNTNNNKAIDSNSNGEQQQEVPVINPATDQHHQGKAQVTPDAQRDGGGGGGGGVQPVGGNTKSSTTTSKGRYIPLTPRRVQFLLSLLDPVHKSV